MLFNDKPAVELYNPPVVPVRVTALVVREVQKGLPEYVIVAEGAAAIFTEFVAFTAAQPPAAAILYVTVYVPAVELDGVTAPDAVLMLKPVVDENTPPEVPVKVTGSSLVIELQYGVPLYEIEAVGILVIVTDAVVNN